jgi:hypothetical protein
MLRPFFGFYGGKWRDTPRNYPPPQHHEIVEPFAGSAGYSVRHGASHAVVLCDKDPVIAGVWKYLIGVSPAEILMLPDVPLGGTVDDLDVCQEARWLIGFWLNRGAARPCKRPSKWMREGVRPGSFWGDRVRQRIASQVTSIRHWRVFNRDYRECGVSQSATWFIDPPYREAGKHYAYGSDAIDFEDLGRWCQSRPGQTIVCEGPGADWLPFKTVGSVKTTRAGKRATERVWLGGRS